MDFEFAPWTEEEWNARFKGKRRYPRSGEMEQSLLGKGGVGSVYRILADDGYYAMKVINTEDLGVDRAQVEEYEEEAKMLRTLKHQHIIQYVRHGIVDSINLCIVLEYATGGSLADRIGMEMSGSADLQVRLVQELADGLNYIHSHKIIHRDLKSSNVLLNGNDLNSMRLKLSDFGLAKQLSTAVSKLSNRGGTPFYSSPEQAQGERYTYSADMWALGCIIVEIVLGEVLKESLWPESKAEKLQKMLQSAAVINPWLAKQAHSLLQQDPSKRMKALELYSVLNLVGPQQCSSIFLCGQAGAGVPLSSADACCLCSCLRLTGCLF